MSTGDAGSLGTLFDSVSREVRVALDRALDGGEVSVAESDVLARATGRDLAALTVVADELRRRQVGDIVTYVVNRNINFTNVCIKHCGFCAFSRDHREEEGYLLPIDEIVRRAREAWDLGATEVCIQAGLPPKLDGRFYIELTRALKAALPDLHLHAFSPEEVLYGSVRSGLSIKDYLTELKAAGLGTLPGTSAEILDQRSATSSPAGASPSTSGWKSSPPRTRSGSGRRRPSCTGTSRPPSTGCVTWRCCATSRRTPAASPSSCRCRSSTARRRCIPSAWCPTSARAPPGPT